MRGSKNKIVKNSSIYVFVSMMPYAVSMFMLPIYTRFLTPDDYGLLSKIPYTLHDDYQREIIAQFILAHTKELIQMIFKEIAIFDEDYSKKIISNLKLFLSEKYSYL